MEAVTIHDLRPVEGGNVLAINLIDILRLAEPEVRALVWRCQYVECMGELAEELHRLSDTGASFSGPEMLRLASGVYQVIDGDFEATRAGESRPWLAIRAVDCTLYVVITEDRDLLSAIRRRFHDVRDSPEDAQLLG